MTQLSLVSDALFRRAVSAIKQRSERHERSEHLEATFVDPGITVQLENENNQVMYGRRGTGKTHIFKVLERHVDGQPGELAVYIDLNQLGSSSVYKDLKRAPAERVPALLKDVLATVETALLDYSTAPNVDPPGPVYDRLADLSATIARSALGPNGAPAEAAPEMTESPAVQAPDQASVTTGGADAIRPSQAGDSRRSAEVDTQLLATVGFRELTESFEGVLTAGGIRNLVLLLDEWTAVPYDLQPYFAEFIKKTFFPAPRIVVKVASLEYRSNFSLPLGHNNVLGFELGADITSVLELDDYFVYDRNTDRTVATFRELLYRHLTTEIELVHFIESGPASALRDGLDPDLLRRVLSLVRSDSRYLSAEYDIKSAEELIHNLFASPNVFKECVRAGEGVARDFINISSHAFFDALRRGTARIDMAAVRRAAREWYEKDKAPNVDENQRHALRVIMDEVIGKRRARSVLLEKRFEQDEIVQSLFDFRLLHLVHRGYGDKDNPGLRYNIYTLDYGTYVDLIGTQRAPSGDFRVQKKPGEDIVVPFDDRRSIRRIVLRPQQLVRQPAPG